MAFGNFWRGGGRERFGDEREPDRNRDRWRTQGNDWRDDERNRWRDTEQSESRYGGSDWESGENYGDRSRGYGGGGYGGGSYASEGYGSGRQGYGGDRYRNQGSERYGREGYGREGYGREGYGREGYGREGYGSQSGRWGSEERDSDYAGTRSGGSEYDYRGGSLYGGGFGRGYGSTGGGSYGTAGSYGNESPWGSQGRGVGQASHRGRGPRNYKRSDERIREDVCDCLTEDDRLDASSIEVAVAEGEVVLTGTVVQREDKRRAEDLAEGIAGVKDVRNNLRVSGEQSSSQGQQGSQRTQQGQQQPQTGQSPRH